MDREKDIIKTIKKMSGSRSEYEVFSDWIRLCSISISNSCQLFRDDVWKSRETEYMEIQKRYKLEEMKKMVEMFGMLIETLEGNVRDVLGSIYMNSGMGSKAAGQFFTPYHLSELCAQLALPEPDDSGKIYINEPSCGGGGMIIAAVSALKKTGFDVQRNLEVTAQDLDWKGVYMCYLQLSLLGVRAICVQGDTLREPYTGRGYPKEKVLYTPAKRGMLI